MRETLFVLFVCALLVAPTTGASIASLTADDSIAVDPATRAPPQVADRLDRPAFEADLPPDAAVEKPYRPLLETLYARLGAENPQALAAQAEPLPEAADPLVPYLLERSIELLDLPAAQRETHVQTTLETAYAMGLTHSTSSEFHYEDPTGLIQVGGAGENAYGSNHVPDVAGLSFDENAVLLSVDLGGDDTYANDIGGAGIVAHPESELPSPATISPATTSGLLGGDGVLDPSPLADVDADPDPELGVGPEVPVTSTVPVSLGVDLAGDDTYRAQGNVSQGAAWLGGVAGVLLDVAGDDTYEAQFFAQGAAHALNEPQVGRLLDLAGDDTYQADGGAQGYGPRGDLVDYDGHDTYTAQLAAQGLWGRLLDVAGDDTYRLDSNGQGAGYISQAGGLLADLAGDDEYNPMSLPDFTGVDQEFLAGLFQQNETLVQGLQGYKGGTLYDRAGDDAYGCEVLCQGATVGPGGGQLVDEGGDDEYQAVVLAQGANLNSNSEAELADRAGNDAYNCAGLCQGFAMRIGPWNAAPTGSVSDERGDDAYTCAYACQAVAFGNPVNTQLSSPPRAELVDERGDDEHLAQDIAHGYGGLVDEAPISADRDLSEGTARFADEAGVDTYEGSPGADDKRWQQGEAGVGVDLASTPAAAPSLD